MLRLVQLAVYSLSEESSDERRLEVSPSLGDWDTPFLRTLLIVWVAILVPLLALGSAVYVAHRRFLRLVTCELSSFFESSASTAEPKPMSRCEAPISLSFSNLTYWAPNGSQIIRDITGTIQPGQMVALMGPSGSGKTTCLDVIAGRRRSSGKTSGSIHVNGNDLRHPKAFASFQQNSAYMLQLAEAFVSVLTVRENLCYSALLRLPTQMSMSERLARVNEVIDACDLRAIADVRVGSSVGGGISGGQKRKLMLATELLSRPSLLFLDEPTSGLDATSAQSVINSVRLICLSGRSAVITIHQPRASLFALFDKLLLLYQGAVAYFGPPWSAHHYLLSISRAFDLKLVDHDHEGENPADTVLDMLAAELEEDLLQLAQRSTRESQYRASFGVRVSARDTTRDTRQSELTCLDMAVQNNETGLTTSNTTTQVSRRLIAIGDFAVAMYAASGVNKAEDQQKNETANDGVSILPASGTGTLASIPMLLQQLWLRVWALGSRVLLSSSSIGYFAYFVQYALLSAVVSSVFANPETAFALYGGLFVNIIWVTNPVHTPVIGELCEELQSTYRFELAAGCIRPLEMWLHSLSRLALKLGLQAVIFIVIAYVVTFPSVDLVRFGYTFAFATFHLQTYTALTMMICFLNWFGGTKDEILPGTIAGACHGLFQVWSGFYVSYNEAGFWQWMYAINPYYRVIASVSRINLQGYTTRECAVDQLDVAQLRQCEADTSGNLLLNQVGFDSTSVEINLLILFILWLIFCLVALLALHLDSRQATPISSLLALCQSKKAPQVKPAAVKQERYKKQLQKMIKRNASKLLTDLAEELRNGTAEKGAGTYAIAEAYAQLSERPSMLAIKRASKMFTKAQQLKLEQDLDEFSSSNTSQLSSQLPEVAGALTRDSSFLSQLNEVAEGVDEDNARFSVSLDAEAV